MREWLQITVVVAAAAVGIVVLILFLWRCCFSSSKQEKNLGVVNNPNHTERAEIFQIGISKLTPLSLHNHHHFDFDPRRRGGTNYYVFRREVSTTKPRFNWADHPSLVTDAVENGWSRFAFATSYTSSSSVRSTLLGACGVGDRREAEVDISWEICQGSADFMQKIRLNSGLKKIGSSHSVIRTALPLPGPPLGNSSFPQEAYFEVAIMSSHEEDDRDPFGSRKRVSKTEGEKAKLIQENRREKANSESLIHVTSGGGGNKKFEELRVFGKEDGKGGGGGGGEGIVMLTVGLTRGGTLPLKLPGSYPGSIGFNSDGSVYLDGIKLIFESEKNEWGKTDKVIGCGYNPSNKKVFFTVDSELVHVINCKSDDFGTPLYPTLASNIDVTVLVNFGQSAFKYAPANPQRTPNPCFIGPLANSPALGYEDSRELFSMGRIDAQWLNRCTTRSGYNNGSNNKGLDFDAESEGDLFEIVLDSSGKSPNTVLQ